MVTLVGIEDSGFMNIMASLELPENTTALVLGCGFGRKNPSFQKYFDFLKKTKIFHAFLTLTFFITRKF